MSNPVARSLRPAQRGLRRVVVALLSVLAFSVLGASAAEAHSSVISTSPKDGTNEVSSPRDVRITFNELVVLGSNPIRIVDSKGSAVAVTAAVIPSGKNSELVGSLQTDLADGWYAVGYEIIAADGHPRTGTFTFLVGRDLDAARATIDDPTSLYRKATDPLRFLGYLTTLLAIGLLLAAWPMRGLAMAQTAQKYAGYAAAAGLVVAPASLLNFALLLNGGSFEDLGAIVVIALQSSAGTALLIRTSALFALCTAVLLASERSLRYLAWAAGALGAGGLAASFSFSGHTTVVPLSAFAGPLLVVHLAAAAAWLGAIPAMALLFRKRNTLSDRELFAATKRFSLMATVSVIAVGVAGTALAVMMFEKPDQIFSAYGKDLLAKIAVVAVFAVIGAYNHFAAVPALERSAAAEPVDTDTDPALRKESPARRRLRRLLTIETAGVVAVALMTTLVTSQGAPAAGGSHGVDGHGHSARVNLNTQPVNAVAQGVIGDGGVDVELSPAQAGSTGVLKVRLTDAMGRTIDAQSVTVELTHIGTGVGPIERELTKTDDKSFTVSTKDFGIAGQWRVRIVAKIGTLTSEESTVELTVSPPAGSTPTTPMNGRPMTGDVPQTTPNQKEGN